MWGDVVCVIIDRPDGVVVQGGAPEAAWADQSLLVCNDRITMTKAA